MARVSSKELDAKIKKMEQKFGISFKKGYKKKDLEAKKIFLLRK